MLYDIWYTQAWTTLFFPVRVPLNRTDIIIITIIIDIAIINFWS
jgi:hypothetical protein